MLPVAVCIIAGLAGVPALAAPDSGSRQLDSFLADVQTFSARFKQTLFDSDLVIVEESTGTFAISRPGRFRWDYDTPYSQIILADGEHLWVYDADLEQATVREVDDALASTPAMLLSGDTDIAEGFVVRDGGSEDGLAWADLTPKTDNSDFVQLRLGFVSGDIRVMELHDRLGQVTRIEFADAVRNAVLHDELFDISLPEGVDVIGLDES